MGRERWVVGQPGGPSGPFYSVVSSDGGVIALQVSDRKVAAMIASIPMVRHLVRGLIEARGLQPVDDAIVQDLDDAIDALAEWCKSEEQ